MATAITAIKETNAKERRVQSCQSCHVPLVREVMKFEQKRTCHPSIDNRENGGRFI